jgi:hypothetical protein
MTTDDQILRGSKSNPVDRYSGIYFSGYGNSSAFSLEKSTCPMVGKKLFSNLDDEEINSPNGWNFTDWLR